LYYTAVISHDVYSVPTDLLADPDADEQAIGAAVKLVATKPSGNDGIACDAQGRIYTTDFEDNSLRRIDPDTGDVTVLTQDERLIWPDTLAFSGNDLYVTVNQLPRQAGYRAGADERQPPYVLFRLPGVTRR
ncbi:MAG TPA: L-dopachrome tautomerase-related protein, partial [Polyangiaceae bacterium]|nr:L-dopachrome tautomerase-related protein [Polyangiaceae bacterium]